MTPGIVFPTTLGEGSGDGPEVDLRGVGGGGAGGGMAALAGAGGARASDDESPPDPAPLRLADQWQYEIEWNRGAIGVRAVRAVRFPQPVVTARHMGRYAIELWIGHELVERVRFDVPLAAAEPDAAEAGRRKRKSLSAPPSLAAGLHAELTVLVPAAERATRAVLVDRATGESRTLPWPPDKPLGGFGSGAATSNGTQAGAGGARR